jgi:hypothetical protein
VDPRKIPTSIGFAHVTTAYPPGLQTRAISVKAESGEFNHEMSPCATTRSKVCDAKGSRPASPSDRRTRHPPRFTRKHLHDTAPSASDRAGQCCASPRSRKRPSTSRLGCRSVGRAVAVALLSRVSLFEVMNSSGHDESLSSSFWRNISRGPSFSTNRTRHVCRVREPLLRDQVSEILSLLRSFQIPRQTHKARSGASM